MHTCNKQIQQEKKKSCLISIIFKQTLALTLKWIGHFTSRVNNSELLDDLHYWITVSYWDCFANVEHAHAHRRERMSLIANTSSHPRFPQGCFFFFLFFESQAASEGDAAVATGCTTLPLPSCLDTHRSPQHRCRTLKFPKSRLGSRLKSLNTVRYPCLLPYPHTSPDVYEDHIWNRPKTVMVPKVSPVLPHVAKLLALAGKTCKMRRASCVAEIFFFPSGHLNAAAAVSLSVVLNQPPVQHQGQKLSGTSALRLLRISNPGNSLRCVLHKLLSNCSRIISVGGSTASETPAQCSENGNIQTSEPIGRSLAVPVLQDVLAQLS